MELQELYGLMERFAASGLTELEWQKKDERVCLRRAPAQVVQAAPAAAPAAPAPAAPKARMKNWASSWVGGANPRTVR